MQTTAVDVDSIVGGVRMSGSLACPTIYVGFDSTLNEAKHGLYIEKEYTYTYIAT